MSISPCGFPEAIENPPSCRKVLPICRKFPPHSIISGSKMAQSARSEKIFSGFQRLARFLLVYRQKLKLFEGETQMKTITLHRPNTIQNALSDFDRYFESFFGDSVFGQAARTFSRIPAVDIRETEKAYLLDMELPGYDENDVEINVNGSSLSIASKQEETRKANDEDQGTWLIKERRMHSFSRSFKIPENANPEEIAAEFKNGILSLEIMKRAEAQKRTIQIKAR